MFAVAIVAALMAVFKLLQRHQKYRDVADYCSRMECHYRAIAEGDPKAIEDATWSGSTDRDWNAKCAAYFARMRNRFNHAAYRPWLTVQPDPLPQ